MSKPKKLTRPQIIAALQRELASEREETKYLRERLLEIKECLESKEGKKTRIQLALEACKTGLADAVSRFMILDSNRISNDITKSLLQVSPFMALIEQHRSWRSTSTSGL